MKDLHYDADFARDFDVASAGWAWATWHQIKAERDAAALNLLQQVFGGQDDTPGASESDDEIAG